VIHITVAKHRKLESELAALESQASKFQVPHIRWIRAFKQSFDEAGILHFGYRFGTHSNYAPNSELYGSVMFAFDEKDKPPGGQQARCLSFKLSMSGYHRPQFFVGGCFGTEGEGGNVHRMYETEEQHRINVEAEVEHFVHVELGPLCEEADEDCRSLVSMRLKPMHSAYMTMLLGRNKVIPWSHISSLDEHLQQKHYRNWWSLLHGSGRALARSSPMYQLDRLKKAYELIWHQSGKVYCPRRTKAL